MFDLRTGIDLCEIQRMEQLLCKASFMHRWLTEAEEAWVISRGKTAAQSAAGLWAAKEAFSKAVGKGLNLSFKEIEIVHGELGEPSYLLHGQASALADGAALSLSITHEGGMAAAICVMLRERSGA